MIVVIEGISAAGKTTWCAAQGAGRVVPETGPVTGAPCGQSDPAGAGAFWAACNVRRWQAALALEARTGLALCDTDPLKLHYTWGLYRIGAASAAEWHGARAAVRATLTAGAIGFADAYFVKAIDPAQARAQARADPTRARRRLDLHLRLQPSLLQWYAALDEALPGRVRMGWPDHLPRLAPADRYPGVAVFDRLIAALPGEG